MFKLSWGAGFFEAGRNLTDKKTKRLPKKAKAIIIIVKGKLLKLKKAMNWHERKRKKWGVSILHFLPISLREGKP